MTNSSLPFEIAIPEAAESGSRPLLAAATHANTNTSDGVLSEIAVGVAVHVVRLALEDDLVAWLRAVGIGEGEQLTVLRHAAFGGPIHVRTRSGGEFALNRSLARCIHLRILRDLEESAASRIA